MEVFVAWLIAAAVVLFLLPAILCWFAKETAWMIVYTAAKAAWFLCMVVTYPLRLICCSNSCGIPRVVAGGEEFDEFV